MGKTNLITAKSYRLEKENGGWLGQIVLTSDGMFASVTDYGNFSFKWGAYGDMPFAEFMLSLETDYFAGKLLQGLYNFKRTKELEHSVKLFSEKILPELKKVLRAEIEAEKLEAAEKKEPVYLSVNNLNDLITSNLDLCSIQLNIDENTKLHYIEINNYETEEGSGKTINRIFQLSFSFYGKHFDVYVRENNFDSSFGSIEMQGDSSLFESFEELMEDDHWPLLVALCKKHMELYPEDDEE